MQQITVTVSDETAWLLKHCRDVEAVFREGYRHVMGETLRFSSDQWKQLMKMSRLIAKERGQQPNLMEMLQDAIETGTICYTDTGGLWDEVTARLIDKESHTVSLSLEAADAVFAFAQDNKSSPEEAIIEMVNILWDFVVEE